MKRKFLAAALMGCLLASPHANVCAQTVLKQETQEEKDKRMEWFQEAKLGIFIHWGIYAVKGVSESWSFFNNYLPYEEYMSQKDGFTASKYNPKEWVDLIKESGAQYAVITTKHHDGMAMWPNDASAYFPVPHMSEIIICKMFQDQLLHVAFRCHDLIADAFAFFSC